MPVRTRNITTRMHSSTRASVNRKSPMTAKVLKIETGLKKESAIDLDVKPAKTLRKKTPAKRQTTPKRQPQTPATRKRRVASTTPNRSPKRPYRSKPGGKLSQVNKRVKSAKRRSVSTVMINRSPARMKSATRKSPRKRGKTPKSIAKQSPTSSVKRATNTVANTSFLPSPLLGSAQIAALKKTFNLSSSTPKAVRGTPIQLDKKHKKLDKKKVSGSGTSRSHSVVRRSRIDLQALSRQRTVKVFPPKKKKGSSLGRTRTPPVYKSTGPRVDGYRRSSSAAIRKSSSSNNNNNSQALRRRQQKWTIGFTVTVSCLILAPLALASFLLCSPTSTGKSWRDCLANKLTKVNPRK